MDEWMDGQHILQQLHNKQQTTICHFTKGLLHVSALASPSSWRSLTKEHNNRRLFKDVNMCGQNLMFSIHIVKNVSNIN